MNTTSLQPFSILVVEDHPAVRSMLVGMLRTAGAQHIWEADNSQKGLALFEAHRPDLVLLDVILPDGSGLDAVKTMREIESSSQQQAWTPILFLSSLNDEQAIWQGIEAGGDDYLTKPVTPTILAAKLRAMQRLLVMRKQLTDVSQALQDANEKLIHLVEIDALTGLVNRRGFDRILELELRACLRDKQPLSLVLIDIDFFKRYNDACGHLEGDLVLKQASHLLRSVCLRPRDVAARYGGEEFALILPNTPKAGAMTLTRGLTRVFQQYPQPHPNSDVAPHITLSGGIVTIDPNKTPVDERLDYLILQADVALYAAKKRGRNRFVHSDDA
ncbi:diguanylate cyclase domain-containing protein [Lampropedia aestuarii]|uniref:diguanylate cyclase domain-containing protein n=1 Tax=Lampropedia aestuarii TaxID=2562762 RepID=UPI002468F3ED|nr:diguanylate cyclase [Lampropedia aestuarii]MDH5857151.1 diguanylate cyclase [Lampropedia aestuarii]